MGEYAIALDIGGTFTDVTLVELDMGRLRACPANAAEL